MLLSDAAMYGYEGRWFAHAPRSPPCETRSAHEYGFWDAMLLRCAVDSGQRGMRMWLTPDRDDTLTPPDSPVLALDSDDDAFEDAFRCPIDDPWILSRTASHRDGLGGLSSRSDRSRHRAPSPPCSASPRLSSSTTSSSPSPSFSFSFPSPSSSPPPTTSPTAAQSLCPVVCPRPTPGQSLRSVSPPVRLRSPSGAAAAPLPPPLSPLAARPPHPPAVPPPESPSPAPLLPSLPPPPQPPPPLTLPLAAPDPPPALPVPCSPRAPSPPPFRARDRWPRVVLTAPCRTAFVGATESAPGRVRLQRAPPSWTGVAGHVPDNASGARKRKSAAGARKDGVSSGCSPSTTDTDEDFAFARAADPDETDREDVAPLRVTDLDARIASPKPPREEGRAKRRRRHLLRFSADQRGVLLAAFHVGPHIDAKDALDLSGRTGLTPKQVRNWFRSERVRRHSAS